MGGEVKTERAAEAGLLLSKEVKRLFGFSFFVDSEAINVKDDAGGCLSRVVNSVLQLDTVDIELIAGGGGGGSITRTVDV